MTKKLLLNSLSGAGLYVVNVALTFIISPVLIRALGNRDYGLWELVLSVIGYMGLLDLGIGGALVRFVSVADAKKDRADLQKTISTACAFFIFVGLLATVAFWMLGVRPDFVAGNETKAIANLGTVFFLLGVNAAMLFPMQVFITTLMGLQRHYFINNIRMLLAVIRAGLTYYLLVKHEGYGLVILAILEPLFTSIQFAVFAFALHRDSEVPKITLAAVTGAKAKELIAFSAKSATMLVASRLQNQSVPLIIGNVLGLSQIVYFVLPNRLVNYAKGLALAVGFPLAPHFGAVIGRGEDEELVESWLQTTLALQVVSLVMPVALFFYGEIFLTLWIGKEYGVRGHLVLNVLLAGMFFESFANNAFRLLSAKGVHGRCALLWLILSAASIPVGIVAAKYWGVAGVAAGTTIVTVVANMVTVVMACRALAISLPTYFKATVARVVFPLVMFAAVLWLEQLLYPVKHYLALVVHLVIGTVFYLPAVWYLVLSGELRGRLWARCFGHDGAKRAGREAT